MSADLRSVVLCKIATEVLADSYSHRLIFLQCTNIYIHTNNTVTSLSNDWNIGMLSLPGYCRLYYKFCPTCFRHWGSIRLAVLLPGNKFNPSL